MGPTWRDQVLANTPQEFIDLMRANLGRVEEEIDIFLKMGFTSDELTIEIDHLEEPPTVHVILKIMKQPN